MVVVNQISSPPPDENAIVAYLKARWAEPETKAAIVSAAGVTLTWGLGALGIIDPPTISLRVMETTDIMAVITAVIPGPISSTIIQQVFGSDTPRTGALPVHQAKMAATNKRRSNGS